MPELNQTENIAGETQNMPTILKYLIITFFINITLLLFNLFSSKGVSHGIWEWVAIIFFGTIFSTIGASIGNFLREIAHPDAILTNGGLYEILKTKIFWAIGPQSIGWLIGMAIASNMLKKWFDIAM